MNFQRSDNLMVFWNLLQICYRNVADLLQICYKCYRFCRKLLTLQRFWRPKNPFCEKLGTWSLDQPKFWKVLHSDLSRCLMTRRENCPKIWIFTNLKSVTTRDHAIWPSTSRPIFVSCHLQVWIRHLSKCMLQLRHEIDFCWRNSVSSETSKICNKFVTTYQQILRH